MLSYFFLNQDTFKVKVEFLILHEKSNSDFTKSFLTSFLLNNVFKKKTKLEAMFLFARRFTIGNGSTGCGNVKCQERNSLLETYLEG